ncbi:MAG TPA: hypothetical protein VK137_07970, partial [Planctomycetaceae bacterium]|nr:hypothetical protein [Planctomycetaceae bacterium]
MRVLRGILLLGVCWGVGIESVARAQTGRTQTQSRPLSPHLLNLTSAGPNRADEPFASDLSLAKTRQFLDEMALNWTRGRKCGTCHTNIAYMLGRASLGPNTPAADEVRKLFETRA